MGECHAGIHTRARAWYSFARPRGRTRSVLTHIFKCGRLNHIDSPQTCVDNPPVFDSSIPPVTGEASRDASLGRRGAPSTGFRNPSGGTPEPDTRRPQGSCVTELTLLVFAQVTAHFRCAGTADEGSFGLTTNPVPPFIRVRGFLTPERSEGAKRPSERGGEEQRRARALLGARRSSLNKR